PRTSSASSPRAWAWTSRPRPSSCRRCSSGCSARARWPTRRCGAPSIAASASCWCCRRKRSPLCPPASTHWAWPTARSARWWTPPATASACASAEASVHSVPAAMEPSADELEYLKALVIGHYVVAALVALSTLVPAANMVAGMRDAGMWPDPDLSGTTFFVVLVLVIAMGLGMTGLISVAGDCLYRRRKYMFCMGAAAPSCLLVPLGTVLGVSTLVVLTRPRTRALFGEG